MSLGFRRRFGQCESAFSAISHTTRGQSPTGITQRSWCHVGRRVSRSISRVLSRATIHLGRSSPIASSGLPGSGADHAIEPLFGLAPGGVYLAGTVARSRGALLPHPFTLTNRFPTAKRRGTQRRFAFCCTCRGFAPPRGYLAPCPVEPGLSSRRTARGCLTDSLRSLAPRVVCGDSRTNHAGCWGGRAGAGRRGTSRLAASSRPVVQEAACPTRATARPGGRDRVAPAN